MQTRKLRRSGIEVSVVGLDTWLVKVSPLLYKADVSSAVLGVHHVITPEPLQEHRLVLLPLHQSDQGYRENDLRKDK